MKILFLILLIHISVTLTLELYGKSCTKSNDCADLDDLKSCVLIGGQLQNKTCEEIGGFNLGSCCNNGNCLLSTSLLCLLGEGKWKSGGECPCEGVTSSCCYDNECSGDYDRDECEGVGGSFYEGQPCAKLVCLIEEKFNGACCRNGGSCGDMPSQYCDGTWHAGETCDSLGCGIPDPVPYFGVNSSLGRCCSGSCYQQPYESCKDDPVQFYQADYGCNQYPCIPKGACIKEGFCQHDVPESLCFLIGGSWIFEGNCNSGTLGRCEFGESCNLYSEIYCITNGGTWSNETECEIVQGACCQTRSNECYVKPSNLCRILDGNFFPNKTCEEISCSYGTCCLSDICFENPTEVACLTIWSDSYWIDEPCAATGACKDFILITNKSNSIIYPVSIQDILFEANDSKINLTNVVFTRTNFTLSRSEFHFETFELTQSVLKMDSSSILIIDGCFDSHSTTIDVEVNDEAMDHLQQGETITLATYACRSGEVTVDVKNNGQIDDCIESAMLDSLFVISYSSRCATETAGPNGAISLQFLFVISLFSSLI